MARTGAPIAPRDRLRPVPRLVPLGGGLGLPILLRGLRAALLARSWAWVPAGGRNGIRGRRGMPVEVLLADAEAGVRGLVKRLLEKKRGVRVVGEAGDGETAVRLAGKLRPDVVLMDVAMPRLDGLEAARRIKAERPQAKVILLTVRREEAYGRAMGEDGADAFLPKRALVALLLGRAAPPRVQDGSA